MQEEKKKSLSLSLDSYRGGWWEGEAVWKSGSGGGDSRVQFTL